MNDRSFRCFLVEKDASGQLRRGLAERRLSELPPGDVLVRVVWSSLNYKDALAAGAHPGVVRKLPHVPGIDAAGDVAFSTDPRYPVGAAVVVTGNELGAGQWGGWSEYIRVPGDWVVALPPELSLRETMILGTAGFTAAQCVLALVTNGVMPASGPIVVTGSTGGVGCLAVKLLAKLGYEVAAVTGKPDQHERLRAWGATTILGRGEVVSASDKPLLTARWGGAVDTVGGATLATIVRETKPYGVVAACGLVGGVELPLTVHPFILRGVILAGIGSAMLPYDRRVEIWRRLASEWRVAGLDELATTVELADLEGEIERILRGEVVGRTVVRVG